MLLVKDKVIATNENTGRGESRAGMADLQVLCVGVVTAERGAKSCGEDVAFGFGDGDSAPRHLFRPFLCSRIDEHVLSLTSFSLSVLSGIMFQRHLIGPQSSPSRWLAATMVAEHLGQTHATLCA